MSEKRKNVSGRFAVILSCEHGGNQIPERYRPDFPKSGRLLQSHRGYDPGALALGKFFHKQTGFPFYYSTISRLLIELNRSLHHPRLFSKVSKRFSKEQQQHLIDQIYQPYRKAVEARINKILKQRQSVIHLSVHTFTPVLHHVHRTADIGLLYDPRVFQERRFCEIWRNDLHQQDSTLRVRLNYPYHGISDGFTTSLRKKWRKRGYFGIEIEVNQKHFIYRGMRKLLIQRVMLSSLKNTLEKIESEFSAGRVAKL